MRLRFALAACCGLLPAIALADDQKEQPATLEIPYKLTDTKHVLVRAKINGKGPFNLILDTGARPSSLRNPWPKKRVLMWTRRGGAHSTSSRSKVD
jgi:hypothetical protein